MNRWRLVVVLLLSSLPVLPPQDIEAQTPPANGGTNEQKRDISKEELLRRTQELFDSVAIGNQTPWKKYFADDCMYFDETGRNMNKSALVGTIVALPTGYTGSIKVRSAQSHIEGNVAILSYDLDENESIYGQSMTARYHGTDTWLRRNSEWQIIAGQIFRYYEDPSPVTINPAHYRDYVGTYQVAPGVTLQIFAESGQLYRRRGEGPKEILSPEVTDVFFRKGVEGRLLFRRAKNGNVDALIDRRNNEDVVWRRVE